jgi:O-antigen ligase
MQPGSSSASIQPARADPEIRSGSVIDRDSLDRWCERGILGLVLAILGFGPLAFGAVGAPQVLVIQALSLGVLVLWMARVWLSHSYRLLWVPICWPVLLFLVYAVVRYRMLLSQGGVEYLARQEIILVLIYGFLFFAILNNLSRQESVQLISIALIGLATLISLYALYQFLTKSNRVLWVEQYPFYLGRASGTYICPNHLAGFLEMILPLALGFTLTGRFRATAKVFLGYASLAIFTGIGVSVSRGGWAATGIALLVFFGLLLRQRGRRLTALIFVALLVGAFAFFIKNLAVLQRRINVTKAESKVDLARMGLWGPAYRIWQDHFWWGAGPAQFDQQFRIYRPDDMQMRPLYAHNDYLNTLADWGLVGMALIGGTMAAAALGILQSWKYVQRASDLAAKRSNRSAFVLGATAGVIAVLAHSVVDFNMHIPANAILAVALLALVTGHLRFATERYWFKTRWLGKLALTLLCGAGMVYLGQEGVKRSREYLLLERASRSTDLVGKVEALRAAAVVEPMNPETTYELGETLRLASWQGLPGYRQLAKDAIQWFELGTKLNPLDPYNYFRWGMCLHWLGQPEQTEPLFRKAIELDPKNYYVQGHVGWHYFQLGDLDKAQSWFEKAVFQAHWHPEPRLKVYETGRIYLDLIKKKKAENAGTQPVNPPSIPRL